MSEIAPWALLALLGAFHGLNPAMGWLFAVSLGLQERSRSAVVRSLVPLAAGHAVSVAAIVGVFGMLRSTVEPGIVRYGSAGILLAFGAFKLVKPRWHPRWVGMRVGPGHLALWSFLMASAHGAGLMLIPALGRAGAPSQVAADAHVTVGGAALAAPDFAVAAVALHTAAMLGVMGATAVFVFDKVGLSFLRRAWFNVDLLWAGALVLAGLYVFVLGVG